MGKILSQEEIDALLGSAATAADSGGSSSDTGSAITYNFRRPDRISKEQIRSLNFLHDRFARNVSTSLSAYLRAVTEVQIVSVEQFTYSEFLMSVPDPTAFYALALHPVEGLGALELNPAVAFTMIDRMLGGSGQGVTANRALTEIEQNVIDSVVKLLLENLSVTWQHITPVQFKIHGRETRPQMLQVAAPNEAMILLVFDLKIGAARGMLNLCIPTSVVETLGASFTQSWYRTQRKVGAEERTALHENLGRVPMRISASIATTLSARDLLRLRPGDVISLGLPLHHPVTVKVGAMDQFEGHPVRIGHHAGIAIDATPTAPAMGGGGE
jgi:flagellar motor switch protein FliM